MSEATVEALATRRAMAKAIEKAGGMIEAEQLRQSLNLTKRQFGQNLMVGKRRGMFLEGRDGQIRLGPKRAFKAERALYTKRLIRLAGSSNDPVAPVEQVLARESEVATLPTLPGTIEELPATEARPEPLSEDEYANARKRLAMDVLRAIDELPEKDRTAMVPRQLTVEFRRGWIALALGESRLELKAAVDLDNVPEFAVNLGELRVEVKVVVE